MEVPKATDTVQLFQLSGYISNTTIMGLNLVAQVRIPYRGKHINM